MSVRTASTASTPTKSQRSRSESYQKLKQEKDFVTTCFESDTNDSLYRKLIPSLYAYSSLHGCIDQLIPTNYKFLESSIGLSPKSLGMLTFAQKFAQGLFTIISGIICDRQISATNKQLENSHKNLISLEEGDRDAEFTQVSYRNIEDGSKGGSGMESESEYGGESETGTVSDRSEASEENQLLRYSKNINFLKIWPAYFMMVTTIGWGMVMISMIFASNFLQMLILLCFMGAFLSLMGPLTQSVIGTFNNIGRSEHFGNLFLSQNIGRLFCISATSNIMGHYFDFTWALLTFSFLSFLFSIFLYKSCIEHAFQQKGGKSGHKKIMSYTGEHAYITHVSVQIRGIFDKLSYEKMKGFLDDYSYVISNKSAWLMLVMGIVNGIPRHSLNFTMMWLQYCGLSPLLATTVYSSSWISAILISPFVGKASDYIESIHPWIGRQALAQTAILLRIIFMVILLRYIPWGSHFFLHYLFVSILIGFMAGWPGVGASRPILCQIVMPHHRATLFAIFSLFETIGSAIFGAPIVGLLAQNYFGYDSSLKKEIGEIISSNNLHAIHTLQLNANALANSMLLMTVIPWILTIALFGLLRLTYRQDQSGNQTGVN
ncbi:major facilitator superfamily transporter [Cryptosporidium sp. chipmunk genotype I]|uniref:major facilitator superfamily transporter n=1 Tax=Cryptosporidium sp. chipmunk genotype I TaxID=1280935 RepID=UPI00351A4C61|nr:major facilitator superfamily transporter [Cryptosporidium sp. chipmunk genotype I]